MRLDFIRPLFERRGPYASVYLAGLTQRDRERHWQVLRRRLRGEADPATLDALEAEAAGAAAGRAMFATHGDVVLAETFAEEPAALAAYSPLPLVTPMLMLRGENVPHLRVIADHAGAELTAFGGGSPRRSTVEATSWPLPKTAQGGWSQKRYERAVEEAWEQTAVAVAHEIDEQVRRLGLELIVLGGEPKSRALLCNHLGTKSADRVMMVEHGSRADHGQFVRDAETALDAYLERRRAELLDRHREAGGPTGRAGVAHALREGRVHAVLMPGELPQPMWIGGGGTQLAPDAGELRGWGVDEPRPERADSALARAATMTDAELWFTPEVADVAAVIRYL
ncbi:Vms1/Ankzf1 family peptidyl-tRNA hydrolase [Nonomuraea sp. NPDC049269]|uniref:baeRF2 domain-containing protein n=1 Tax=Nonomuraea sp. NPDC049269 TaxID=3364349 RepID=UPI003722FDE6